MNNSEDLYLMHHGIKGMKWGVRRFEDKNGHLTPAGKRRYGIQDARKYYKINRLQRQVEKTKNEKVKKFLTNEIRRTQTRSDRKKAILNQRDINIGREIVAKHRLNWAGFNTAAKAGLTAAGAYALYKNPETRALAPAALALGGAATLGSAKKVPYYFMENYRYKQANKKGDTKKGLTKRQQNLRKLGKAAALTALTAGTGYALYKSGIGRKGSDVDIPSTKTNLTSKVTNKVSNYVKDKASKAAYSVTNKAKDGVSKAASSISNKAKTAVKNKFMGDFDDDNPSSWLTPLKNGVSVAKTGAKYMKTANAVRKQDYVTALTEITPDAIETTNKLIDKAKDEFSKFKNKRSA